MFIAGVSVCWHQTDPGKLLVAERGGTLRLYNTHKQQAILSCDTQLVPLTAADWSPVNSSRIAALAAGHLLVWDITRSRWEVVYCTNDFVLVVYFLSAFKKKEI